jgi:hypothetical protein
VHVLDLGAGQLALLCKYLWDDRAAVADININGPLFNYLRFHGVHAGIQIRETYSHRKRSRQVYPICIQKASVALLFRLSTMNH